jgi:DNA-binding response OmpR family regulator
MTRPTIVLAEDDRFLRRAVDVALSKRGFNVILAADGVEALAAVHAHKPALLLLDLLMPRMGGMEVLTALRHDSDPVIKSTRVLILSNSSKEFEMKDAEALGISGDWIKANLSLQELGDRVNAVMTQAPA